MPVVWPIELDFVSVVTSMVAKANDTLNLRLLYSVMACCKAWHTPCADYAIRSQGRRMALQNVMLSWQPLPE